MLVVLVGPGASGKSTWAAEQFAPTDVVSSDALRALVGAGPDDITASVDAFALLDDVVRQRVARSLTTVVDTLGLDAATGRRSRHRAQEGARGQLRRRCGGQGGGQNQDVGHREGSFGAAS